MYNKGLNTKKQSKLYHLNDQKLFLFLAVSNPATRVSRVDLQKNAFLKFFYKINDASGKKVVITAEKVIEETNDNFIFEKVTSNFMPPNEETGTITSNFRKVIRGDRSVC